MTERDTLICADCGRTFGPETRAWRCDCGGLLGLAPPPPEAVKRTFSSPRKAAGFWRYGALLPLADPAAVRAFDEGPSPLVRAGFDDRNGPRDPRDPRSPLLKLDYLLPSGSFKDRGSAVMINRLRELGVTEIVEDSSGNAGASVATYAARNELRCTLYVPADASPGKLAQMAQAGATLVAVEGPREKAAEAAHRAVEAARGAAGAAGAAWAVMATGAAYYAGHNLNPYFIAGLKTWAYEVFEQLGGKAPDDCVVPVGGGSLLVGAHQGFADLVAAGLIGRPPRLWAVQSEACPPVVRAVELGLNDLPPVERRPTVAEGIALTRPPRGRAVLAAIKATGGGAIAVAESDILPAARRLAGLGFFVEPTSAAAWLGYERLAGEGRFDEGATVVVALTGSGLKYAGWPAPARTAWGHRPAPLGST